MKCNDSCVKRPAVKCQENEKNHDSDLPDFSCNPPESGYICRQNGFFSVPKGMVMDLLRILIAILLPPLGVFLQVGFGGAFWLNILLTLCGYIPGIVHAVWVIARR